MGLVAVFFISRVVSCIDTAMPYSDKMKVKEIAIESLSFNGDICEIHQKRPDGNSYFFKSYGGFNLRDLDTLKGKKVIIHSINRRGFGWGIFPRYRVCRIESDSVKIFSQVMYRGMEYMSERKLQPLKQEWLDEWGNQR